MQPDGRGRARDDARTQDPMIGRLLDRRYRITDRIARGGMASVYTAHDDRLDRTVAIKIMHAGLDDRRGDGTDEGSFAARFVREARSAARLTHPNVVAVYDQGTDISADGTTVTFLAMEYVPGHTLRDTVIAEAPMPARKALAVMEPVLSALAAAHRAGLVHRDVKPENVLISSDGRQIKVADFGLARAVSSETQHTSTGVLIGTVSYLAPELVTSGTADARADVYAAGVLLYELLTGTKPHAGETPIQVAYKHVHTDVPPPSQRVPGLPAYVDALVARATARDRDLRPADAGVMLHQLRRVQHALASGIVDDPDLVADLALPVRVGSSAEPTEAMLLRTSTTPVGDRTQQVNRTTPNMSRSGATVAPPTTGRPAKTRRRRGPVAFVLALLLASAVGVGAWWFGFGRYADAPGVLQLTQAQAVSRLEAAGLHVELADPAYSDTVAKGRVMASDPAAGDRVLDGGTVTITISKGVEEYRVPDEAGKTLAEAESALKAIKMDVPDPIEAWSETVPRGMVISTSPKAGVVLRPGTAVTVTVSKGRRPITVTSWVGKSAAQAQKVLEKAGLIVRKDSDYSEKVDEGEVINQSPGSGTFYRGDTITLLVSKGPPLVTIPGGLRGSGVDDATKTLEALGLKVEVENSTFYAGLGYVLSVDPGSGEKVRVGSTVRLSLF